MRREYAGALATLGRVVRIELANGTVVGRTLGVDDTGRLLVEVMGEVRVFDVGDVVHVRRSEADLV